MTNTEAIPGISIYPNEYALGRLTLFQSITGAIQFG
jgi:hypothetical protein